MGKITGKMPSEILDRLKAAMAAKGVLAAPELARLIPLNESTARSYLNGTRSPSREACLTMGPRLGVSGEWLYTGRGAMEVAQEGETTNLSDLIFVAVEEIILLIEANLTCGINVEAAAEIAEVVQLALMNLRTPRGMTQEAALRRVLRWEIPELLKRQ